MQIVYTPTYIYTVAALMVVIFLNTAWAVLHAIASGTFDSEQLPNFLVDDVFKLLMLTLVGVAAMVRVPDGDEITLTIFSSLKYIFGAFTVMFGTSLLADLNAKFKGEFGDPELPAE